MDYNFPMEEQVRHHPGFRRWERQWRLFSLLSSQPELLRPTPPPRPPASHVSWEETAAAHLFSASLPGNHAYACMPLRLAFAVVDYWCSQLSCVRKEEIRVEVEDGRYLSIRTELDAAAAGARIFDRKFRLPGMVDVDGISAAYTHGVLTVTVPRMHTRARPAVDILGAGPARDYTARAA